LKARFASCLQTGPFPLDPGSSTEGRSPAKESRRLEPTAERPGPAPSDADGHA